MDDSFLARGKRVDNGEWVQGFYSSRTKGAWLNPIQNASFIETFEILKTGEIVTTGFYEVIPETVGRCTGLRDKDGKLIFDGDIVALLGTVYGVIVANLGHFVVEWRKTDYSQLNPSQLGIWYYGHGELKIIGNIHDTPQVLEGEYKAPKSELENALNDALAYIDNASLDELETDLAKLLEGDAE